MSSTPVTYTSSQAPLGASRFVCKRCKREYNPPQPGARPIRCECGWWYYNDGVDIRETYWQRIAPYRVPPAFKELFPTD